MNNDKPINQILSLSKTLEVRLQVLDLTGYPESEQARVTDLLNALVEFNNMMLPNITE